MLQLKVDPKADAAYVRIANRPVARTREKSDQVNLDYDAKGELVGIEFLDVSDGVNLDDLPYHDELVKLFEGRGFKIYA